MMNFVSKFRSNIGYTTISANKLNMGVTFITLFLISSNLLYNNKRDRSSIELVF